MHILFAMIKGTHSSSLKCIYIHVQIYWQFLFKDPNYHCT